MRGLFEIFALELKALVRSKTLAMLTVSAVTWMLALPRFLKGDGTADGARELYIRFSLGGVFLLLVIALLASATGSLARERAAKRLQLVMVRPVRCFSIFFGKFLAHVAVGALVMSVACVTLAFMCPEDRPCNHVLSPLLPPPRESAKRMYDLYMQDEKTPEAVKKTKKEIVLRLLENREADRYQVLETNETARWRFEGLGDLGGLAVRLRFTNQYEMRQDVRGLFRLGGCTGVVSNITQAVVTVPLGGGERGAADELMFENRGASALMLRPRKDIHLLIPADGFRVNLLRTYVALVSILALVIAFGLFLSSGLGRPVALFVAFVTLVVGEMSPSVVEQYPDELETKLSDRIGLVITRTTALVTRPVSAAAPLEAVAKDECVEPSAVLNLAATGLIFAPLLLALLSAAILPRKQDDLV